MITFAPQGVGTPLITAHCDRMGCEESAPVTVETAERSVGLSGPHIQMQARVPAGWTAGPESGGDVLLLCPTHSRKTIDLTVRTP